MGTFIIVAAVMTFLLAGMGMWAIVVDIFQDTIQDPIIDPILQYIANTRKKGALFFIPICVIFMSVRRAITYFPAWLFIYICMATYGYPADKIYQTLAFFIVCAGMIKTGAVTKEYYPNAKAYKKNYEKPLYPDYNIDNLFED